MDLFANYQFQQPGFDELFMQQGLLREDVRDVLKYFKHLDLKSFSKNHQLANQYHKENGVTFNHFSENNILQESIFPFDLIPRIIFKKEWDFIKQGLIQRLKALNLFLNDIYQERKILENNTILNELVKTSAGFLSLVQGLKPKEEIYIHIAGIDLIRNDQGQFVVLEDNLRTPSGVSYVLENRKISQQIFADIFKETRIMLVEPYPSKLFSSLNSLASDQNGLTVLLTPGPYNPAYFEHCYLAERMGCKLVEGNDLYVKNNKVFYKSKNKADREVSVIYRRIDDYYLDPTVLNRDSLIGVPGLFQAYASGNVVIVNALGNGIADDKAIFPFVPEMIRYYLKEEPILEQVKTYSCLDKQELQFVLNNLDVLVIKSTNGSGGQEVFIGKNLSTIEKQQLKNNLIKNRRNYIAQPLINFSFSPTFIDNKFEPRRADFRPYVVFGETPYVLPGGLTRVALKSGGYIVNSCQGGGSKDTWIIDD